MDLLETVKQDYFIRLKKQLSAKGYPQDDVDAIIEGLSEYIDEEVWLRQNNKQALDVNAMKDILGNLQLPENVEVYDLPGSGMETEHSPLVKALSTASLFLSLMAFPLLFIVGYVNQELAFDIMAMVSVTSLSMGVVGYKTQTGRKALVVCILPLSALLFFIWLA